MSPTLKYLGVVLDPLLHWQPHVEYACGKALRRLSACKRLAARTWGLSFWLRKVLYRAVFVATLLYAAPVWAEKMLVGNRNRLRQAQRKALIWVVSAYNSISYEEAWLLAGEAPIEHKAVELSTRYKAKRQSIAGAGASCRKEAREEAELCLKNIKSNGLIGQIAFESDAVRKICINHVTVQYLTGHGLFRYYLHWRKLEDDDICLGCMDRVSETADHVMFKCDQFQSLRDRFFTEAIESSDYSATEGEKILWKEADAQAFVDFCQEIHKLRKPLQVSLSEW